MEAAKERLQKIDAERVKPKIEFSPRDEVVLDAMIMVKKYETVRLAKAIAERQRENIIGKTKEQLKEEEAKKLRQMKGEPEPHIETPEEKAAREARERDEERLKNDELTGFDPNYKTLVQEAAELTDENPEAAAAVIKQWIGNVGITEIKNE
jgi:flagellar biosynthesis/type III secretory pathway M-ring protein FliF/YscJ